MPTPELSSMRRVATLTFIALTACTALGAAACSAGSVEHAQAEARSRTAMAIRAAAGETHDLLRCERAQRTLGDVALADPALDSQIREQMQAAQGLTRARGAMLGVELDLSGRGMHLESELVVSCEPGATGELESQGRVDGEGVLHGAADESARFTVYNRGTESEWVALNRFTSGRYEHFSLGDSAARGYVELAPGGQVSVCTPLSEVGTQTYKLVVSPRRSASPSGDWSRSDMPEKLQRLGNLIHRYARAKLALAATGASLAATELDVAIVSVSPTHDEAVSRAVSRSLPIHERLRGELACSLPEGTMLVIYDHRDGVLRAVTLDEEGESRSGDVSVSRASLTAAINHYRWSLGVMDAIEARAPIRNGETRGVITSFESAPATPQLAREKLETYLFPGEVRAHLARAKHLVIVPRNDIGTIPFAALEPFGDGPIVDSRSVSIAAEAQVLTMKTQPWTGEMTTSLIIGDPDVSRYEDVTFPQLPGAAEEATNVAAMVGGEAAIGESATLDYARARLPTADLIYVAAHGVADPINPLAGSFLALSGDDESGPLSAAEVLQTPLRAQLAVLSACQTGLGKGVDGGTIGLARAFHIAGVPRVMMSLWSVDDAVTRLLMESFVEHAASGVAPAVALQRAMMLVRQTWPEPRYWASFTLFGTPR